MASAVKFEPKNNHEGAAASIVLWLLLPCLLRTMITDLNLFTSCRILSCQDPVGSLRARMEFKQTRSVPPSCKSTCIFIREDLDVMMVSYMEAEKRKTSFSRTSATAIAAALARSASTMPTVAAASAGASLMPSPTIISPPERKLVFRLKAAVNFCDTHSFCNSQCTCLMVTG
nr:hypothetical protein Iba_scaffold33799CG0030 [Ipomoea batatas]